MKNDKSTHPADGGLACPKCGATMELSQAEKTWGGENGDAHYYQEEWYVCPKCYYQEPLIS